MKKLICILAGAALLGACEQKTETVAPAAPAEKKTENNTTVVNPAATTEKTKETNTTNTNTTTTVASPSP
jgi:PBP1b-binding outer membrane lipoprotein LpoB